MSQNVPEWFRPQYEARAMHIYQTKGYRLRGAVTTTTEFSGSDKAIFYLAGKTVARKIDRDTGPVPGGGARIKFEVPLETWQAFDELKQHDLDRLTLNEREVIYESGGMALGRATDIEIYAKLAVAAPTVLTGFDFSAGAFNAAQAMMLTQAIVSDKVPFDGQIYCGLPEDAWFQFLANKVVNSADHVGPDRLPFVAATDSRFWNGVNWFLNVEEDVGDFYPVPEANKRDAFIWHQSAIGWAPKEDLRVFPQWDNRMAGGGGWTINMQALGACSPLQQGKGIRRFRLSSNATITIV